MRKSLNRVCAPLGVFASFVQVFKVLFSCLLVAFFKKSPPLVALVLLTSEHLTPH